MELYKWTKQSLINMDREGYKIMACDSGEEALKLKALAKEDKKCSQAGYVINRENKTIYFVLIKNRNKEPLGNVYNVGGLSKKIYNIGG